MPENLKPRAVVEAFIEGFSIDSSNFDRYDRVLGLPYTVFVEVINRLIDGSVSMDDFNSTLSKYEKEFSSGADPVSFIDLLNSTAGAARSAILNDMENVLLGSAMRKIDDKEVVPSNAVLPVGRSEARYNMQVAIATDAGKDPGDIDLDDIILNMSEEEAGKSLEVIEAERKAREAREVMDEAQSRHDANPSNSPIRSMYAAKTVAYNKAKKILRMAISKGRR